MPERGKLAEGPDGDGSLSDRADTVDRLRRASVRAFAHLPRPVRLLWIILAILGTYALVVHLDGVGLVTLIALPAFAAETDFLLQMFRFHHVRPPDASVATGLLLALLLPPTVSLFEAGAVTVAAVVLKHVLRYGDRPMFNPAGVGVLTGALFFGMAPSWWGSIDIWLLVPLGIILTLRTPGSWRLPGGFTVAYGVLQVLGKVLLGGATSPTVLLLGALDPAMLFFAFFMVAEPRTSPTATGERLMFGGFVGITTALLPVLLPSLAPLVALVLGNLMVVSLRRDELQQLAPARPTRPKATRNTASKRRRRRKPGSVVSDARIEWGTTNRVAAGVLVILLLGGMAMAMNVQTATPFSAVRPAVPAAGNVTADCSSDSPAVSPNVLTFLHQRLGPSVILSVDTNAGTVVFYDPVNHVTVTETDMYEDFGYAEFNGDDYAVAGCSR